MRNRILDLIIAYANGQCTADEKGELEDWVNQSDDNRQKFKAYLRLGQHLASTTQATKSINRKPSIRNIQRWLAYGGVAACLLLSLWLGYQHGNTPEKLSQGAQIAASHLSQIRPGNTKAYLQIGNEQLEMNQHHSLNLSENLTILNKDGKSLYYSGTESVKPFTIVVPRGSEFDFTLADGSHVWLNSESSITFPSRFAGNSRNIGIQGEVYLEVSKDASRPFKIQLSQGNIQVLGTHFYIQDRPEENLSTVLVEGSIAYTDKTSKRHLIKPNEKLSLNRNNGNVDIQTVNTDLYTSWISKLYVFDDQRLEDIMQTLSRWYDFDYHFESASLKDLRLSGRLNRKQSLINLLRSYQEIAAVQFRINGKHIYIQQKIQ